jgi:hypothetical protein
MEIQQIVKNVEPRGAEAVEREAEQSPDQGFDLEVVRQNERQK